MKNTRTNLLDRADDKPPRGLIYFGLDRVLMLAAFVFLLGGQVSHLVSRSWAVWAGLIVIFVPMLPLLIAACVVGRNRRRYLEAAGGGKRRIQLVAEVGRLGEQSILRHTVELVGDDAVEDVVDQKEL